MANCSALAARTRWSVEAVPVAPVAAAHEVSVVHAPSGCRPPEPSHSSSEEAQYENLYAFQQEREAALKDEEFAELELLEAALILPGAARLDLLQSIFGEPAGGLPDSSTDPTMYFGPDKGLSGRSNTPGAVAPSCCFQVPAHPGS